MRCEPTVLPGVSLSTVMTGCFFAFVFFLTSITVAAVTSPIRSDINLLPSGGRTHVYPPHLLVILYLYTTVNVRETNLVTLNVALMCPPSLFAELIV